MEHARKSTSFYYLLNPLQVKHLCVCVSNCFDIFCLFSLCSKTTNKQNNKSINISNNIIKYIAIFYNNERQNFRDWFKIC